MALARERKVSITHIFETHIHADLVSGARDLCALVNSAKVFARHEGGARYGFDHEELKDGDKFTFGKTIITAKHTPGHTPEHVSYTLAEKDHPETPWGVLSGDSLFVNSAGRPDLLGSSETEELTKKLFETLRGFYLALPDSEMIFPAHGHGSPCGADIGDRLESTVGYERKFNPYLQFTDFEKFKEHALSSAPPVPKYYPLMKKVNAKGPEVLGNLPRVPGLPAKIFNQAIEEKTGVIVDTRLRLLDEQTPPDRDLHLILDNYATHKHPKVKAWLNKHPRFHLHFTPRSASWLNMVERFSRDLTTQRLRRGVSRSLPELIEAITAYLGSYNANPTPFVWTATASDILAKVKRARRKLHTPR